MKALDQTENELISVNLKILIDLANTASALNLNQDRIRSNQGGAYQSRLKGRGMEFDEARLYQPGDDIRSIDWRVTARTGKTHTKVYREERERPVFISVDYRSTMAFATRGVFKSVQAAKLAALLAWAAQQHSDRIGGQIFTDSGCQELKPQNGKHAVLRFLNALVSPANNQNERTTLDIVLARLVQHARPGSRLYIISDFRGLNNKVENHLSRLARHCDVVLIEVFDPLEQHLPARGRYRFTDKIRDVVIDTGDSKQLLSYQQHFQQKQNYLQQLSKKFRMTLIQCKTTDDPVEILR